MTLGSNRDVAATFTKIIATSLAIRDEAILSIVDTLLAQNPFTVGTRVSTTIVEAFNAILR
jgi:hypothetical protein